MFLSDWFTLRFHYWRSRAIHHIFAVCRQCSFLPISASFFLSFHAWQLKAWTHFHPFSLFNFSLCHWNSSFRMNIGSLLLFRSLLPCIVSVESTWLSLSVFTHISWSLLPPKTTKVFFRKKCTLTFVRFSFPLNFTPNFNYCCPSNELQAWKCERVCLFLRKRRTLRPYFIFWTLFSFRNFSQTWRKHWKCFSVRQTHCRSNYSL